MNVRVVSVGAILSVAVGGYGWPAAGSESPSPSTAASVTTGEAMRAVSEGVPWTFGARQYAVAPIDASHVVEFAGEGSFVGRATSHDFIDGDLRSALAAWTALHGLAPGTAAFHETQATYQASVARLLTAAADSGQFIPGKGLVVQAACGPVLAPIVMHGAVWRKEDVQGIRPAGDYHAKELSRLHRSPGWGIPVVVKRRCATGLRAEEAFLTPGVTFAATALLRPHPTFGVVLDLFDPLHPSRGVPVSEAPMAYDISGPFAQRLADSPELRSDWLSFFGVDLPTREGLFFLEPYQRGKIPVVLVHGVLSNPVAWVDMANDLRAIPGFSARYQLWGFRYSTDAPFLQSASKLRQDLYRAAATVNPAERDDAIKQITLVGHSMGGLICELQISHSENRLWDAVSRQPIEAIVADEQSRRSLHEMFYFDPQPNVRCVISIAAPHRGSPFATRPVGRLGALLAGRDRSRASRHEELLRNNPEVFSSEVVDRVPTSIDMLKPQSQILAAIASLPAGSYAEVHTIYGYGYQRLGEAPGDGVVAVESALSPRAISQTGIEASHSWIHRTEPCVAAIVRILNDRFARVALTPESLTTSPPPGETTYSSPDGGGATR